jgi:hypothetical protein
MTTSPSHSQLVQNYIAGRLSESERTAFEDRLLSDATLVQDLEESLRLREGLEILHERNQLVLPGPSRRWARAILPTLAAALAIIALFFGWHPIQHSPVIAASVTALHTHGGALPPVVGRHTFATLRNATQPPVLDLPTQGALELRALTSSTGTGRSFRITLEQIRAQGISPIATAEHLIPDPDGFVVIYADASRLQPGDYALIVEPDADDPSSRQRFAFGLEQRQRTALPAP